MSTFADYAVTKKGQANFPTSSFVTIPCGDGSSKGPGCGEFITGASFVPALKQFLDEPNYKRFKADIVWNGDSIKASRLWARHEDMPLTQNRIDALVDVEKFYNDFDGELKNKAFVFCYSYPLYDQYRIIAMELVQTFIFCLVCVTIVATMIIIHPVSVAMIVFILGMVFCCLLGSLNLWGLELNAVSSICLIMSMGLVVDYCMHIMHNFSLQDASLSRDERVVKTVEEMGPAIFLGVATTFGAILPLAFARAQIFRVFFNMFLGIVLVGGLHGMLLTPVLLSFFGPSLQHPTAEADEKYIRPASPATEIKVKPADKDATQGPV